MSSEANRIDIDMAIIVISCLHFSDPSILEIIHFVVFLISSFAAHIFSLPEIPSTYKALWLKLKFIFA